MRLRPLWALCPVLGCLAFSFGCGQAGVEAGAGDEIEGPEIGPSTAQQGAGEEGALVGTAGDDVVRGLGGNDKIHGGEGEGRLYGGPGDDVIDAQDYRSVGKTGRDEIFCGPGRDEVLMNADDGEKPRDCEMATEGIS